MTDEERAAWFKPDGTPRNLHVLQFTHVCELMSQWAHEPERTVRLVKVRLESTRIVDEEGYGYDRHMNGAAIMQSVRPHVYFRRLRLDTLRPIVRNRLPRERVRL